MGCVFCNIVKNHTNDDVIYEDDNVIVIPDKYPVARGHMLVIPKKHYRNILEMDDDTVGNLLVVAKKMAQAAVRALGAQGVNILTNIESAAGQVIMHAHIHVIPRFYGDSFGFRWIRINISEEEKKIIARTIKEHLED